MSRSDFLLAVKRGDEPIACGPGTSIVSIELMESLDTFFPEAHLDSHQMSRLAGAGHTEYGFDVVMPLFSVWHESAALGCDVDWGRRNVMRDCSKPIWESDEDVVYSREFLDHPACRVPLEAIGILKRELGSDAAVCGKVFGPWTLGYHLFGVQEFLMNTLLNPDMLKRAMAKLKNVTIYFAEAQLEAGADCLLLGDHATRDLCSPDAYDEFLKEMHSELVERIESPLILHICGDTSDRISMIADTAISCFHWDTKTGSPGSVRQLAGSEMSLMGGLNNTELLRNGEPSEIEAAIDESIDAGIDIIAPECAVPLDTPMRNLREIGRCISLRRRSK